jgi:hypothetical protein
VGVQFKATCGGQSWIVESIRASLPFLRNWTILFFGLGFLVVDGQPYFSTSRLWNSSAVHPNSWFGKFNKAQLQNEPQRHRERCPKHLISTAVRNSPAQGSLRNQKNG